MRQIYLKMLVAIALVLAGSSANAQDDVTNVNIGFTGTLTTGNLGSYALGDDEICGDVRVQTWGVAMGITDGRLKVGNGNITFNMTGDAVKEKDVVNISFEIALGGRCNKNASQYIQIRDTEGSPIVSEEYTRGDVEPIVSDMGLSGAEVGLSSASWADTPWNDKLKYEYTLDYANKKISLHLTKIGGTETVDKEITMPADKKTVGALYFQSNDQGNLNRGFIIDNVLITTTVGDYSTTKTITYKYEDEDGEDITSAALAAGGTASATPENGTLYTPVYPQSFTDGDYAYDYEYVSGGDAFTVSDDATITLVYSKTAHPTTDVKVQYVLGDKVVKETLVAESYPVGKPLYYWVNKYVLVDGTLYQTAQLADYYQRSVNATEEPFKETLTATDIKNVVFLTEAEDIEGVNIGTGPYAPIRTSNGAIGYSDDNVDVTTLAAGKYKIYLFGYNGNSAIRNGNIKVGDNVVLEFAITQSTNFEKVSDLFVVEETSTLSFASQGAASGGVDYFYIVKVEDASVTIGTTGYATFSSTYALDLTDVEAYYVTADGVGDETVTLTKAEGTVAAGTGLILAGSGEVTIPVAATGTTLEGNLLVGCTTETTVEAAANKYVLVANDGEAEFQSLADNGATIPAGKAYLEVPNAAGAKLHISFGDATAIKNVEVAPAAEGIYYNLAGQRVANPTKGIYIVNGQKVLVK